MQRHSFDNDWLFDLGDVGQAAKTYDDASWRRLDLPHDWSIELPPSKDNPTGASGGYVSEGVGWYRKHFHAPREWSGQCVMIELEGVYRDAEVWLNGYALGVHPSRLAADRTARSRGAPGPGGHDAGSRSQGCGRGGAHDGGEPDGRGQ